MKRLIKDIILISFLFQCAAGYSQNTKMYNGDYEGGTASYDYYENEKYERIYHGDFNYKGESFDIKGSYNNGKRNGNWSINAINKVSTRINYRYFITLKTKHNTKIEGVYNDGFLVNDWYYYNSDNSYDENKKVFGEKSFEKSTASFENNRFIGALKYEYHRIGFNPTVITGRFTNLGFFEGTWLYKRGKTSDEIRYLGGVACFRLRRDSEKGSINFLCDSTSFVKNFWENFNPKEGISIVNNIKYFPDTLEFSNHDYNYGTRDRGVIDLTDSDSYDLFMKHGLKVWTSDITGAFGDVFKNPLYYFARGSVRPRCFEIVIKEFKAGTVPFERASYKDKLIEAEEYVKKQEYDKALKCLESASYIIANNRFVGDENILTKTISDVKNNKLVYDAKTFFKNGDYLKAVKNYEKAYSNSPNNEIEQELFVAKKYLEVDSLKTLAKRNHYSLIRLYTITKKDNWSSDSNIKESIKKPRLINAYSIVYNDINQRYLSPDSIMEIDRVIHIQEKIRLLINENTKALEKKLKNVTDKSVITDLILSFK